MTLYEEQYRGHVIKCELDGDPMNPRTEWDNITTMVCFHKKYKLGDRHGYRTEDFSSWAELEAGIIKAEKPLIIMPLYLLDHSGITISTRDFHDPWDSGRVGFVYITRKSYEALCGPPKRMSPGFAAKLRKNIEADVWIYNQYLWGLCFGVTVEKDDDIVDSCWGYYLSPDETYENFEAVKEARARVDDLTKDVGTQLELEIKA
jgi:hypothetical protein